MLPNSPLAEIVGFHYDAVAVKEFSLSEEILDLKPSDLHSLPSIRVCKKWIAILSFKFDFFSLATLTLFFE